MGYQRYIFLLIFFGNKMFKKKQNSLNYQVEESSIKTLHDAIFANKTNCVAVVKQYISRSQAYNSPSSLLVTPTGSDIEPVPGVVRANKAIDFPTNTISIDTLLPNLNHYEGPPIEFGRMEKTASNPEIYQQFGMIVGKPNAGQLNALATLNIRGERSVTCRGDYDLHPSMGPLPDGAPAVCELFRQFPDALEQAADLDAQHGNNPPLDQLPLYGVFFLLKTRSIQKTCARLAEAMQTMTLIFQLKITCLLINYEKKAQSFLLKRL